MNNLIRVKCPFDGAVITVLNHPGIESKSLICPICKHKYPFTQFKRVIVAPQHDEPTDYDIGEGSASKDQDAQPAMNFTLGRLKIKDSNISYQLKPGKNIIGRKARKSNADFGIDTGAARAMSREHIMIEIKKVAGKGFVHYISLCKEKINDTFVGGEQLYYGDCIVLNDNTQIRLPGVDLIFEIPDEEGTDI